MAKKRVSTAIENLVNSLDSLPPEFRQPFKQEAMAILPFSKALEDGSAISEAEEQITSLEEQIAKLELQLRESNQEVEALRAEQEKQKEAKRKEDIPDIQFQILKGLPSEHDRGTRPGIEEIARNAKMPVYQAGIHLKRLEDAERITWGENSFGTVEYHRTIKGDELVLARHMASEGEPEKEQPRPQRRKYPNLSLNEDMALAFMAEKGATESDIWRGLEMVNGQGKITLRMTELILLDLDEKKFARIEDEMTYGAPVTWILTKKGMEYLAERGRL